MFDKIAVMLIALVIAHAPSSTALAAGLDLEGYKVVKEEVDDGTVFRMKAVVYEIRRAVFPGDDVPREVKAAASAFCRGLGEPTEVAKEDKGKSYLVAYRCPDLDQGAKVYGITPSDIDWLKCDVVAAVSPQRIQASMAALSSTQKSAVVLNCESDGWVRLRSPGGGTGGRPEMMHLFFGDSGAKMCRAIETEFRALAPKLTDKQKWDLAMRTPNKNCPTCGPTYQGTMPAVILSDFIRQSRSCDAVKDSEYLAKLKVRLEGKSVGKSAH